MRRSPFLMGLLVLSMTAGMTLIGTTSAVATTPDLTSVAGINAYLVSIGVDPGTATWQQSKRNYAGPSCPGAGWNCVPASTPIVQFAPAGATNVFDCRRTECVAVQSMNAAAGAIHNSAACKRYDKGQATITQSCDVAQDNTTENNDATVQMTAEQTTGSSQTVFQAARVVQTNDSGDNHSHITQKATQNSKLSGGGTQDQNAHQGATVDQQSASGNNSSDIGQVQNQTEQASGGASITQNQNAPLTGAVSTPPCDLPGQPSTQDKNECANLNQNSPIPGSGKNDSTLHQTITEKATASSTMDLTQNQGTVNGGESGDKGQHSSGVSTSHATQAMTQRLSHTNITNSPTRNQFTGDPRCCQNQDSNPNDQAFITQNTVQTSNPPGANQNAFLEGDCVSSGDCNVKQTAMTDADSFSNTCMGPSCFIVTECFGSAEEGFCGPGGD